jgi:predicted amidohydrolase
VTPVRLTVLELPARWNSVAAQVGLVKRLVEPGTTDLVLLPETTFTGYVSPEMDFDLGPGAEPLARGVERLHELATACGCDVAGPVIERDAEQCFNSLLGVGVDGSTWLHYRKRHPWYPETWATPGDLPFPLVQRHGLSISAAICFDLHFVAEEAHDLLRACDLLLFPSAWVSDGLDTREEQLLELAATFDLTVANANWGPGVPRLPGQGRSMVVRADQDVRALPMGAHRLDVIVTV